MSALPEHDPQELMRSVAAALRFARYTGAEAIDRRWAKPLEVVQEIPQPQPVQTRPVQPRPQPQQPQVTLLDPAVALQKLNARIDGCVKCVHSQSRSQIVFGQGNPRARLMLVGDAPGPEEDRAGLPWQGESGALLDKMLAAIGLARADVWMTTVTLCLPPQPEIVAREPLLACSPYLRTQMETVKPEVVLLMGEAVSQFLLRKTQPLAEMRGQWTQVLDRATLATWAPAHLLSDPAKKRQAWADLQAVQAKLAGK